MKISIATEFSGAPVRRHREDGKFTGEEFREDWLAPNLENATPGDPLVIDLNGAAGYSASFLDEAFGGLVRKCGYTAADLEKILQIKADNGYKLYKDILWDYIREAKPDSK